MKAQNYITESVKHKIQLEIKFKNIPFYSENISLQTTVCFIFPVIEWTLV